MQDLRIEFPELYLRYINIIYSNLSTKKYFYRDVLFEYHRVVVPIC